MAKKKNKKELEKIEKIGSFNDDIINKIYVVLGVIIFLSLFSLLTLYITKKNSETDESKQEPTEAVIDYKEIMLGRSLSMSDNDYLVIYYDKTDEEISSTYYSLVSDYEATNEHLDLYTVDMGNSFNKSYAVTGESNKNPASASDMAINGPTLVKVSAGKVVEYIEGEEAISDYLK